MRTYRSRGEERRTILLDFLIGAHALVERMLQLTPISAPTGRRSRG